jgi:hypothetical protein
MIYNLKTTMNQDFHHFVAEQLIKVMNITILPIQFVPILNSDFLDESLCIRMSFLFDFTCALNRPKPVLVLGNDSTTVSCA